MRPLVALVLVAIVAFTVGYVSVYTLGQDTVLVALALLCIVAAGGVVVGIGDLIAAALERRAERRRPRVFQPAEAPRRIRQGRP